MLPLIDFSWFFLGLYVRKDMGKNLPPNMCNELVFAIFCLAISPMVGFPFHEKWEAGVWNQGASRILLCVLSTSYIYFILAATISRVPPHLEVWIWWIWLMNPKVILLHLCIYMPSSNKNSWRVPCKKIIDRNKCYM